MRAAPTSSRAPTARRHEPRLVRRVGGRRQPDRRGARRRGSSRSPRPARTASPSPTAPCSTPARGSSTRSLGTTIQVCPVRVCVLQRQAAAGGPNDWVTIGRGTLDAGGNYSITSLVRDPIEQRWRRQRSHPRAGGRQEHRQPVGGALLRDRADAESCTDDRAELLCDPGRSRGHDQRRRRSRRRPAADAVRARGAHDRSSRSRRRSPAPAVSTRSRSRPSTAPTTASPAVIRSAGRLSTGSTGATGSTGNSGTSGTSGTTGDERRHRLERLEQLDRPRARATRRSPPSRLSACV